MYFPLVTLCFGAFLLVKHSADPMGKLKLFLLVLVAFGSISPLLGQSAKLKKAKRLVEAQDYPAAVSVYEGILAKECQSLRGCRLRAVEEPAKGVTP